MPDRLPPSRSSRPTAAQWLMFAVLIFLVTVLALQDTTHAVIMAKHTTALWVSVVSALAGVILLRSGWGRSEARTEKQLEFGTLQNSFYQPRRDALTQGAAVCGGVAGALWWGVSSWMLMFAGMRRHQATRGLWDFEISVLVGALAGAVVGATLGLIAGHVWEQRHRRDRRDQGLAKPETRE
ncbi:MAG TPA: hypothetical protein VMV51_12045 [Gemmatimonadaceae bacterium]|nr:hypothetical protein [Gemmatimonadaceae bacterium]